MTEMTFDGKPTKEIPFARLSRMGQLKVFGKADETEVVSEGEDAERGEGAEEKCGKGKSIEVSDEDFSLFSFLKGVLDT